MKDLEFSYDFLYLEILRDILENGSNRPDRTAVGSRAVFGKSFTIDLNQGFPMLTTRKISFRIAFEETMFFLRGETDTTKLEAKNINIWKGNTSREFLDKVGLNHLSVGNMGKGYGFQWRNFGGTECSWGIDQIVKLLDGLKNDSNSRRHLVTAWNPQQLDQMALPPCHIMHQYQILNGKLNSLFFMRSVDCGIGLCTNVMGYALLNLLFSKYLNLIPGTLTFMGGDCHLYLNQIEMATEQVTRDPFKYKLPVLNINKEINTINDIFSLEYSDIEVIEYKSYPDIKSKPAMAV